MALLLGQAGCGPRHEARPAPPDLPIDVVWIAGGTCIVGSREGRPHEQSREVEVEPFWMGSHEVSVSEYAESLRDRVREEAIVHPQILRRDGRYVPRRGEGERPIVHVSYDEARGYCAWLSARSGLRVSLPTEDEWECAARGGIRGARYPWGWGAPKGRAHFRGSGSVAGGTLAANPLGLFDMAGNVYEWCLAPEREGGGERVAARGGSWAERDPRYLMVFTRVFFGREYRDADVGFRVIVK